MSTFGRQWRNFRRQANYQRRRTGASFRNRIRRRRYADIGYVVFPIGGPLPERRAPPRGFIERQLPLPTPPLSVQTVRHNLRRVAEADNVRGVVLIVEGLSTSLATLQTLRGMLHNLRRSGKRVIVYTGYLSLAPYYLATSADLVVAPPLAEFNFVGLQIEVLYLRDALAEVGVKTDVIQVSPYKAALSQFDQQAMTEQEREQFNWLLDEQFDMITADIAADRGKSQEEIKALINWAPFSAADAVENGLLDAVAYDDELPYLIAQRWPDSVENVKAKRRRAKLIKMGTARKMLIEKVRRRHVKQIAVATVEGMITMQSVAPLLPIPFVGRRVEATAAQLTPLLRSVEKDDNIAALVLYIDSPGGDALASDLIWRQLNRLRAKKPIVVYLGNVAASGGYYIAAGGSHIIAQPATITGSIGVISARVGVTELLKKLHVNRVTLQRGKNAGIYRDLAPLSDEERAILWQRINDTYAQFKQVVADGRNIDYDRLDPICEGRVWTGRQARTRRLVDGHGDFDSAVQKARALAKLPLSDDIQIDVVNFYPVGDSYQLPPKVVEPATRFGFHSYVDTLQQLFRSTLVGQIDGRPLCLLPFHLRIW